MNTMKSIYVGNMYLNASKLIVYTIPDLDKGRYQGGDFYEALKDDEFSIERIVSFLRLQY